MATQVQFRRGTATQNNSFTGAAGEISINTTNDTIRVHDGSTQGGAELAKADLSNTSSVGTLTATTFSGNLTGNVTGNTSGTAGGLSGTPDITVGTVTAATLDISGNVDVDGTLEADAITIDGTSLAETISDTVGAMVSSNTETNITVTYDDSDNTLDFVIGTLNQDTTGNAGTATSLATARTLSVSGAGTGSVSFDGSANADISLTLANSGVTAATYGSSSAIPIVTVDAKGLITSATTTSIDSTTISNGSASVAVASNGPITSNANHDFSAVIDVTGNISVSGTVDGRDVATDGSKLDGIEASADVTDATNVAAAGAVMEGDTTTASMSFVVDEDNMSSNSATKVPTQQSVKAYVDAEVAGVVDSAPGALNTLNELAAALGDDANFSTTVTNSIAAKLPLAGGTMTGNIVMSGSQTVDGRDLSADGSKLDGIAAGAISDIVSDTSPQLGGTLDTNGKLIQFGDSSGSTDDRLQFGASQDPLLS